MTFLTNFKFGKMKRCVRGKFTRWRKGMRVKVSDNPKGALTIERIKYGPCKVTCMNVLCNVPRSAVKILPEP